MKKQNELAITGNELATIGEEQKHEINGLLQFSNMQITNSEENQKVVDLCRKAKELKKNIDEKWRSLTSPFKVAVKNLDKEFKPYSDKLKELEDILKDKLGEYDKKVKAELFAEQERINKEQQEKYLKTLKKCEKKGETPPAPPAPVEIKQEKASGQEVREHWVFRLVNVSLVPKDLIMVDSTAINAKIRDGMRECPGLEIYNEPVMAIKI